MEIKHSSSSSQDSRGSSINAGLIALRAEDYCIQFFSLFDNMDSKPQLAVWNLSKLSMQWSYQISAEAISTTKDGSQFAILAVNNTHGKASKTDLDGIILLFEVENPIPVATWRVRKAKGGGLAFLAPDSLLCNAKYTEEGNYSLQAYINGDHEYVIFNPQGSAEVQIVRNALTRKVPHNESEDIGYTSIYGELPEFDMNHQKDPGRLYLPDHHILFHH